MLAKTARSRKGLRTLTGKFATAEGHIFKSLLDQIGLFETELREAKVRLETMKPEVIRVRIRDTRRFVEAGLNDLQKLLNGEPRLARAELAKHIQKIVLTPQGKTYVAVGDWNLLGLGSYGGAGGPDCTYQSAVACPGTGAPAVGRECRARRKAK
jgi:hypothetical protein